MQNEKQAVQRQHKAEHKSHNPERIEILYQDQYIAVIDKPAGLLSVPYPGSKTKTAQSVLEELLRKHGAANTRHRPFAVHRLDRDTSGVMMFALTEQAQTKIMENWHKMVTERLYIAVAEKPRQTDLADEGTISDKLAQNAHNVGFVPKESDTGKDGKTFKTEAARTHYKMLEKGETHVLFELSLDTGKKNQIRAHLAFHGFPLEGDKEHRAKTDHFHRLCLHARTLEFDHPFTGEHLKFEVPEPKTWRDFVKKGDFQPKKHETAAGTKQKKATRSRNSIKGVDLGEKRLSRKDLAHMDFIERGKHRR